MISREEFNHQIQTGKVREALASVLQSLSELDITTQIATDRADRPYFRTRIDLLGGRVLDEVSANFAEGDSYLDLQQLHAERVAASYDLARDYLERIESLLGAMPATPGVRDAAARTLRDRPMPQNGCYADVPQPKSPPPALVAKLQQARASLTSRLGGDTTPAMLFPSRTVAVAPIAAAEIDRVDVGDESDDMTIVLENPPTLECGLSEDDLAAVTTIVDEEIDLAIALSAGSANEENGELWAGWVEEDSDDEDEYSLEAISPQPPTNPTLLDWQEIPTPKYVDAIEVKPIIPRPAARSLDPIAQWDKFEPDYLGIDFDPQPAIKKHLPIDN